MNREFQQQAMQLAQVVNNSLTAFRYLPNHALSQYSVHLKIQCFLSKIS